MVKRLIVRLALAVLATGFVAAAESPARIAARVTEAYDAGRFGEAAELAGELSRLLPRSIQAKIILARALAGDGQSERALRQLERVVDHGLRFDSDDPAWDQLRDESKFQALVKEMLSRTAPVVRSEPAFLLEKDLIPENVGYDPETGSFYVGSMYKAKIIRIDRSGAVSDFVSSGRDGLLSVLGMKIDPVRRELWAVSGNFIDRPPLQRRDPGTEGKGEIFRFDLDTGELLRSYPAAQWSAESPLWFNDLVIAPDETVYITAGPDGIHRLRRDDEHPEPYLKIESAFFNGITISPDGSALFAASHGEGVIRIDVETREHSTIAAPQAVTLGGIDGLYFHDGSLVAVQNGVDPARVIRAWLDPEWRRVVRFTVLEQRHPLSDIPLTGVIVGSDLYYVARSQLRAFDEGTIWPDERLKETVILKLPIEPAGPTTPDLEKERAALLAMHEKEIRAHFDGDAEWIADTTAETFLSASSGTINRSSRDDVRRFFTGYLEGATYTVYEDLEPPVVQLSDDASTGWIISRIRVHRTKDGTERSFVYAGIMIYEKRDGEWVRIANVSTFE